MKVSIIVPAYNAEKYLAQTMESIIVQTLTDWELLLIDDGSTDGTAALARGFCERDSRIRLVQKKNGGLSAARNTGVEQSSASVPYIIFLDADDIWVPKTLETLYNLLEAKPDLTAAHGKACFIDSKGEFMPLEDVRASTRQRHGIQGNTLKPWPVDQDTTFNSLAFQNCIWTAGQVMIRRSALEQIGLFDTGNSPVADWDMWLRIAIQSNIAYTDELVLYYRRHDSSMSRKDEVMRGSELLLRRKLLTLPGLTAEQRRVATLGYRLSERYVGGIWLELAKKRLSRGHLLFSAKLLRRSLVFYIRSMPGVPV